MFARHPAQADMTGVALVIDGDTIEVHGLGAALWKVADAAV